MPLDTLADVQRELGRVYREARSRRLDWADASRAAHILGLLGRLIEGNKLGRRLEALEAAQDGGGAPGRPNGRGYARHRATVAPARSGPAAVGRPEVGGAGRAHGRAERRRAPEIVELCHAPTCANCRFLEERWLCRAAEAPVAADGALAIEDPPAPCAACRRCVERRRAEIIGPIP